VKNLIGCVNDVEAWIEILKDTFGFNEITSLINDNAKKKNILDEFKRMVLTIIYC